MGFDKYQAAISRHWNPQAWRFKDTGKYLKKKEQAERTPKRVTPDSVGDAPSLGFLLEELAKATSREQREELCRAIEAQLERIHPAAARSFRETNKLLDQSVDGPDREQ